MPTEFMNQILGEVKSGQIWQVTENIGLIEVGEKFIVGQLSTLGDSPRQHIWQCLLCNPTYPTLRIGAWQILLWCTLIENPDDPCPGMYDD